MFPQAISRASGLGVVEPKAASIRQLEHDHDNGTLQDRIPLYASAHVLGEAMKIIVAPIVTAAIAAGGARAF